MFVHGLCKQHVTGLVLAPLTVFCKWLCSLFSTVKLMHVGSWYQHYLEGLHLNIRASIVRLESEHDLPPTQEDYTRNARVLELCYYSKDLHVLNISQSDVEKQEAEMANRLRHGRKLLEVCAGDWRSNHISHWSCGCCTSDAEAAQCVFQACMPIIGHAIATPALNKWTQVWPAASQFVLGGCLHNLLPRSVEYAHTLTVPLNAFDVEEEDEAPQGQDDGRDVGLPRDERRAQQQEKAARSKKPLEWVTGKSFLPDLLVWLCVARHVMVLHYFLFRDASSMKFVPPEGAPEAERHPPVFDFCNVGRSRASLALSKLSGLLFGGLDGHQDGWGIMYDRYGTEWPASTARLARCGIFLVYGNLWRRLVWYFTRPPWRWAKIANPQLPMEDGWAGCVVSRVLCHVDVLPSLLLRKSLPRAIASLARSAKAEMES